MTGNQLLNNSGNTQAAIAVEQMVGYPLINTHLQSDHLLFRADA